MSINNLPIGNYTVKAWKQGYIAEEKETEVSSGSPAEVNFTLKKRENGVRFDISHLICYN